MGGLTRAVFADDVAPTLQAALDDWDRAAPRLADMARDLNGGKTAKAFPFDQTACASPLPRAYQWADGSAYVTHVELVRKARGAELPPSFWTDPLLYQGGSDGFLGPRDAIFQITLTFILPNESAAAVIVIAIRLLQTIVEVVMAGIGWGLMKRRNMNT